MKACVTFAAVLAVGMTTLLANGKATGVDNPSTPRVESPTLDPAVHTFSIVAYDPDKQEWGVGVASKFLAVGAVVPWAKAGVGAIATQSYANTAYGPDGLKMLAEGRSVKEIASAFILSVKTIEAHKFNLMRKLDIHNKAQLVQYAIQKKVIRLPELVGV